MRRPNRSITVRLAVAVGVVLALALTPLGVATAAVSPGPAASNTSAGVSTRIIGGQAANRIDTPWFVQLLVSMPDGNAYDCGGTAISAHWVLTAAHCVDSKQGTANTGIGATALFVNPAVADTGPHLWIDRVVVHRNYRPDSSTARYDVALIHTNSDLGTSYLPVARSTIRPLRGQAVIAYGFGLTSRDGDTSTYLKQVTLRDLSGPKKGARCGRYTNFNSWYSECVGVTRGRKGACFGDSGGAIVAVVYGVRRIVGIDSSAVDCASTRYPEWATRVSSFAPWISRNAT